MSSNVDVVKVDVIVWVAVIWDEGTALMIAGKFYGVGVDVSEGCVVSLSIFLNDASVVRYGGGCEFFVISMWV